MDYKKIIKNRTTRERIMRLLSFIPDEIMVKIQYKIKTGRKLNVNNPERYTEKLQWYKLNYRDSVMKACVDKYEVRRYIESLGLSEILNECYGVYDNPNEIDFTSLPNSFVVKDTLGGGGNSVIIVKDKSKVNYNELKLEMLSWVKIRNSSKHPGREWVYDNQKHRIIIEKYIECDDKYGLTDYKFFCFDGQIDYLYIITDRSFGNKAGLGVFDINFNQLNVARADEKPFKYNIRKPSNFDEMLIIAKKISQKFPHVRVDLYNVKGKIIFGEMTFFDGSGYMVFEPDEFDYELGKYFNLVDNVRRKK